MARLYQDPFGPMWRFNWVRTLLTWEGGIFQLFWMEWLCAIAACALAITFTYFYDNGNGKEGLSDVGHSMADATNFLASRFQAAIGLMLGFFSVQCFARWKGARALEGNVIRTINDASLRLSWAMPDPFLLDEYDELHEITDSDDDEKKEEKEHARGMGPAEPTVGSIRLKLARWLNLSHAIVVGDIYETRSDFCSLEKIRDNGLATELEYKVLKSKDTGYRYVAPLAWSADFLRVLKKKELFGVDEGTVGNLTDYIMTIRGLLEELYMMRNTPIPLCYRQLTNFAVRSYMFILVLDKSLAESAEEDEAGVGFASRGLFWFIMVFAFEEVVFLLCRSLSHLVHAPLTLSCMIVLLLSCSRYFLFVGWLTVADALGNPFRCWSDEIEWDTLVKGLYISSLQLASGMRDEKSVYVSLTKETKETVLSERCTVWKELSLLDPIMPKGLRERSSKTRRKLTGF